jgi:hypothetical protein
MAEAEAESEGCSKRAQALRQSKDPRGPHVSGRGIRPRPRPRPQRRPLSALSCLCCFLMRCWCGPGAWGRFVPRFALPGRPYQAGDDDGNDHQHKSGLAGQDKRAVFNQSHGDPALSLGFGTTVEGRLSGGIGEIPICCSTPLSRARLARSECQHKPPAHAHRERDVRRWCCELGKLRPSVKARDLLPQQAARDRGEMSPVVNRAVVPLGVVCSNTAGGHRFAGGSGGSVRCRKRPLPGTHQRRRLHIRHARAVALSEVVSCVVPGNQVVLS